jgi:hypothetical protein
LTLRVGYLRASKNTIILEASASRARIRSGFFLTATSNRAVTPYE